MSTKHTAVSDFPRRDARDKLQGRTRYTVDRAHVGMLHAALARAERPAGRVRGIDTAAAQQGLQGVTGSRGIGELLDRE